MNKKFYIQCPQCKHPNRALARHCWNCGQRLQSFGWPMLGGNPQRAANINAPISSYAFVRREIPLYAPITSIGDQLVLIDRTSIKTMSIDYLVNRYAPGVGSNLPTEEMNKIYDLSLTSAGIAQTAVILLPYAYLALPGLILRFHVTTGKVTSLYEAPQISPNSAPLAYENETARIVAFGLTGAIFIAAIDSKHQCQSFLIPLEESWRSPVMWNDQLIFVSENGKIVSVDIKSRPFTPTEIFPDLPESIAVSAPFVVNNHLFLAYKSWQREEKGLLNLNLESGEITPYHNIDFNESKLEFGLLGYNNGVICTLNDGHLFWVPIEGRGQKIELDQPLKLQHWQTLVVNNELVALTTFRAKDGQPTPPPTMHLVRVSLDLSGYAGFVAQIANTNSPAEETVFPPLYLHTIPEIQPDLLIFQTQQRLYLFKKGKNLEFQNCCIFLNAFKSNSIRLNSIVHQVNRKDEIAWLNMPNE